MARKANRISDVVYNARRRMKRALNRELLKAKENQNFKKIADLTEKIQQTYFQKGSGYLHTQEKYMQESEKYTVRAERSVKRKNEMMKYEINQASVGGTSRYAPEAVKIFYAGTKNIWQGKPQGTWNEAIMKHYGVESLHEAWKLFWKEEAALDALKKAVKTKKPIESDADIPSGVGDEKEDKGSPTYIKELIVTMDTR